MTMRGLVALAALAALAGTAGPALAHHSFAMFDTTRRETVSGTVVEFQYTNPHSWLKIMVVDAKGGQQEWNFEAEGPSTLMRSGIKRSSLQPGDKVTISFEPMRDGRPAGRWRTATKADGTVLKTDGLARTQ